MFWWITGIIWDDNVRGCWQSPNIS